ncbi:MAG: DUF1349 domain-containing protein, partial [Anaerolineae bacterium]|nr:DUF1349 domain-containing protein [Anaerolineae bacterium]
MNLLEGCYGHVLTERLAWLNEPPEWRMDDEGLLIVPAAETDFFRPYGGTPHDNACLLYTEVTGDFTAVTQARAHLVGFGDAAAITVRAGATQWAKLCVERSPIGDISAVSVVTNPTSDDANNELLGAPACFLRITRKGDVFGMHYSLDGRVWRFVRTFGMAMPETVMVGI